jgi:tetratricopeptide (TPR) repeat protein
LNYFIKVVLDPGILGVEITQSALTRGSEMKNEDLILKVRELNHESVRLYQQGKFDHAFEIARQAVSISRSLGEEHPDYATSLHNLAFLYQAMGRCEKAEPLYLRLWRLCGRRWARRHPNYAVSLHNLAALYISMGRYEKAEPLLKQALEIVRNVLGDKHPGYASSLNTWLYCIRRWAGMRRRNRS